MQLSSREACVFVYKKTIFEINNDLKKNVENMSSHDKEIFSLLDKCFIIYKNICTTCISQSDIISSNKTIIIHAFSDKLKEFSGQVNHNLGNHYLECIYLFVNFLLDKPISINHMFQSFHLFVTKLSSNKDNNYSNLQKRIQKNQSINDLSEKTDTLYTNPKLLVEWIFDQH